MYGGQEVIQMNKVKRQTAGNQGYKNAADKDAFYLDGCLRQHFVSLPYPFWVTSDPQNFRYLDSMLFHGHDK